MTALEILRWGTRREGAPVLVFLHEGLGSAKLWRDFPARVAEDTGLAALAYSRPGYGASPPVPLPRPLTYMQDEARGGLPRLLRDEGIDDVILVGHSDGASIAIAYAAERPARAVILEAPHVFVEDLSIASIAAAKRAYEEGDLRARLAKHHGNVDAAFRGWNDAWLDPAFRESFVLTPLLPRITAPVLVVQGEDDEYGTRAQVDAIASGVSGPCDVVMLDRCGHAPHRDRERETRAAVVAFVRDVLS